MTSLALLASLGWPIVLAAGLLARRTRPLARPLVPWAALPALFVGAAGVADIELHWLLLGGRLGLDAIAAVLFPVTAGLWLAAGLFAQHYLSPGRRRDGFFVWFLAALAGNLLLLAALDAIVFYLGFALMSFASYGLVVHDGDARALHAGRYYISLVVIGEICVVSALMLLASQGAHDFASLRAAFAGDPLGRNDLIIGLLLVGFGIKAGVFGLHFWLPLAHPVAPAPASAVLSGAMIKAGLVAWMRLLPLGEVALPAWGSGLALLGLVTAYYGALAGLGQREAKTVLAYSSVSQMGVMTTAIGLGLAFPDLWPALFATLLIYMVHHALAKGGLFLGAGLARHALRPAEARILAIGLSLGAVTLAGGPWSGGSAAKLALNQAASQVAEPWNTSLPVLLSISSVLTALLVLRFLWIAWPKSAAEAKPTPLGMWGAWLALVVAWLATPWLQAAPELRAEAASLAAAGSALWPILLAGALTFAAVRLHRVARLPALPQFPAGDLGIPLERGVLALGRGVGKLSNVEIPRLRADFIRMASQVSRSVPAWSVRFGHGEAHLVAWSVTGLLVCLLAAALAWLLA